MTKISENILRTITDTQVKPEPKWKFLAKNWLTLFLFGFSLLVGALSFAVILDIMANYDWDIYTYLHQTFLQYVLFSLPYVWITLLALFLGLAYYDFIHIKGWYRYRMYLVFFGSLFLSIGLGTAFFFVGFGNNIDTALNENVPLYKASKVNLEEIWNHPDEGLLEGEIVRIEGRSDFVLKDPAGKYWSIQDGDNDEDDRNFVEGEIVRIIGDRQADDKFKAKDIREDKKEKAKKAEEIKKILKKEQEDKDIESSGESMNSDDEKDENEHNDENKGEDEKSDEDKD